LQRSLSTGWQDDGVSGWDPEDLRRRRARNWAMLVVLLALSVLFFLITIVKMMKS
jgi:hypothetical protein